MLFKNIFGEFIMRFLKFMLLNIGKWVLEFYITRFFEDLRFFNV